MRRLLFWLLPLLLVSSANAATYFVISGTTLATAGSDSACNGLTDSVAGAAGAFEPNCAFATLHHAIDVTNAGSGGDTVNVKGSETVATTSGYSTWHTDPANCTGTVSPTYAIATKRVTIQADGANSYTLNLNTLLGSGVIFDVGSSGSKIQKGSGSLSIINKKDDQCATQFAGRLAAIMAETTNITIDGLTLTMPTNADNTSYNSGAIRVEGDGGIVRNNTATGGWSYGLYILNSMTSVGSAGIVAYGNTFNMTKTSAGNNCTTLFMETNGTNFGSSNTDSIVIANNLWDTTGSSGCDNKSYIRENTVRIYIFNNRFKLTNDQGRGAFYLQDDVLHGSDYGVEDMRVFNNTVDNSAGGRGIRGTSGVDNAWGACFGSAPGDSPRSVQFKNNLWSRMAPVAYLQSGCVSSNGGTHTQSRSTNDVFDHNLCYAASSPDCLLLSGGPAITETNSIETTVSPGLTSDLHLSSSGSNAVGACTNNPLGQGAGVCSVTANGITFDCTRDFENDQRPAVSGWDCGADQFTSSTGPVCGNNVREGTETCDGTDLNGQTCLTQGFAGGGTLTCNVSCTSFVTSGCLSGQTTSMRLNGATFIGVSGK